MRPDPKITHGDQPQGPDKLTPPSAEHLQLVEDLRKKAPHPDDVEVDYDENGHARHLVHADSFIKGKYNGNPRARARQVMRSEFFQKMLGLEDVELRDGEVTDLTTMGLGHRVQFSQWLTIPGRKRRVRVLGGNGLALVKGNGDVPYVNSTFRHGPIPADPGKNLLSRKDAIEAALAEHGIEADKHSAKRVASLHNGQYDPAYQVVLTTEKPEAKVWRYLVLANSGKVVFKENRLHYGTPCRCFLRIPDPETPLNEQVRDYVLNGLPDPTMLQNQRYIMKVLKNGNWEVARAKADGTFNYAPEDPEFSAVVTFVALNLQFELYEAWGMPKQTRPIPVFCDDPSVTDNAYFDPENYEIHLGVGSGTQNQGLTVHISYDLGVELHENGHHTVFLTTPGHDLPGSEGAAMHESTGDTLGDLLMDFIFRILFTKELNHTLTKDDVAKDRGVVGSFALPPDGIRIQVNHNRTPQDKKNEPHADGLISGGATYDLLRGMVAQATGSIMDALVAYGKLYLAALALVPAHKVMFKDLLRCMITADQQLNKGATRALIVKSFSNHGITLDGRIEDPDSSSPDLQPQA